MPPNELDKIFEPFILRNQKEQVGASMVQRTIDDHGGTVDVISKEGKDVLLYKTACWK